MSHFVWHMEHIELNDTLGNLYVFGIRASVEQKILAHGCLSMLAPIATSARGAVVDGYSVTLMKALHS